MLRKLLWLMVLAASSVAIAALIWIGCSQDPPLVPGMNGGQVVSSTTAPGLYVGPVAGLTTGWHPAPRSFAVPRGVTVELRCPLRAGEAVTWHGATESDRGDFLSVATCPTDRLGVHKVSVVVERPTDTDGKGKGDDTPVRRSTAQMLTYECTLEVVDVPVSAIRVGDVRAERLPVDIPETASNWELMRAYRAGSIAGVDELGPGRYVSSVETPLYLSALVSPGIYASLLEWRIDGSPALLGSAVTRAINATGPHRIEVGPPDHASAIMIETYRVSSIAADGIKGLPPDGKTVTFRATTDPVGFESHVSWLAATRDGTVTPLRGRGRSFSVRFDNTFGADGTRWIGVRADQAAISQDGACDIATSQAIALALKSLLALPSGVSVYLNCAAVPPGSNLTEQNPDGADAVLQVPATSPIGNYYVAFIDDAPDFKFGHAVRYVWVDYTPSGIQNHHVTSAEWPPVLNVNGQTPGPFQEFATFTISGTTFKTGDKGGKGYVNDISTKSDAGAITGNSGTTQWKRKFFIFDGGDADSGWSDGTADDEAADADAMQAWLTGAGFDERFRVSQYWGNTQPGIRRTAANGNNMRNGFRDLIQACGAWFQCVPNPNNCCHEFFLYINAHGNQLGFAIFDPTGNGNSDFVSFADLAGWLNAFPPCVKVIVFVDACRSGGAVAPLSALCAIRAACGVTIVTATDAATAAPSGQGPTDSGTQDFMDGAGTNHDGDAKTGDFFDRWREMQLQGGGYNPQRFMCPGQASMCSTD